MPNLCVPVSTNLELCYQSTQQTGTNCFTSVLYPAVVTPTVQHAVRRTRTVIACVVWRVHSKIARSPYLSEIPRAATCRALFTNKGLIGYGTPDWHTLNELESSSINLESSLIKIILKWIRECSYWIAELSNLVRELSICIQLKEPTNPFNCSVLAVIELKSSLIQLKSSLIRPTCIQYWKMLELDSSLIQLYRAL